MKKLSFLFAALVAGVSTVLFADPAVRPDGLTDLTSPNGVVTTTTTGSWVKPAKNAFDNGTKHDNDDRTIVQNTNSADWTYDFGTPTKVNAYELYSPGTVAYSYDQRMPKNWTIAGKNEGDADWTILDTQSSQTGWKALEGRYYEFDNETAYRYYRFLSTATNEGGGNDTGAYTQFDELEFFYYNVSVPMLGDCTLTKVEDGKYSLSGVLTKNDATAVKIVLSTSGQEDVVKTLGTATEGVPFELEVTSEGLRTDVFYTATVIAENASGVSTPKALPESYFFGVTPKVMNFKKKIDFVLSDEAQAALGAGVVDGVPVAVRVSTDIQGFDYDDMNADGTDVIFGAVDGSEITRYPYELEKWDPNGESVFWVKVPSLSAATTISMCYGNNVFVPDNVPTDVWSDYIGVWHMNEASGDVADATGNELTATPKNGSNNATQLAQMVAAEGVIGNARVNSTTDQNKGNYLSIPNYDSFGLGGQFTMSAFIFVSQLNGYPRIFSRKTAYGDTNGWEIENANNSSTKYSARGADGGSFTVTVPSDHVGRWMHLALAYDNKTLTSYVDGAKSTSGSIAAATDNAKPLSIGNNSNGSERSLLGFYDEVRLYKGAASANYIAAEYAAMLPGFLAAGDAEPIDETAVRFAGKPSLSKVGDAFKVSVTAASDSGTGVLKAVYDAANEDEKSIAVSDVVEPDATYAATLTEMTADKSYRAGFFAVNDKETETRAYATDVLYNGTPTITKGADADEKDLATPGTIIVSRGDAYGPLTVNYTVGGTAVGGTHYRELPGTIVIPDGATSATIEIWPIRTKTDDHTVTITLAEGLYFIDDGAKSATIAVKKLVAPDGWNTWVASESGKASDAANWSDGVPKTGDKILFDARYSTADCEWDGGVNGLTDSVAAWKQSADYTGTVQIDTVYDGAFAALNVSGDAEILGGAWTHQRGAANVSTPTYRLKVIVGGDFTLGSGVTINLKGKGLAGGQKPSGSTAGSHAASGDGYSKVYGNVYAPDMPGSGSNGSNNWGGGAFWLETMGAAVIDGTITVRTDEKDSIKEPAAGSVYIKAASCSGSGKIYADYSASGYYSGAYGSGGRVAIILTTANELALPEANVSIHGVNAGASGGGGGTFFLKTANQTYGTLILDDTRTKSYGARWHKPTAITAIPAGETWTFDAIKIKNYGMLAVPAGTTLNLPNGIASITATSTRQGGILYDGGTINWGDGPYEFAQPWIFQANSNFVFNADVTIKDKGNFGCLQFAGAANFSDMTVCDITVNGNLTIEQGGCVFANGGGPNMPVNRNSYAYHGGATANNASLDLAYDSVFNPAYPGYTASSGDQAESSSGGGVIKLAVNGCLAVDGSIVADGDLNGGSASGSGGTINITAKTLADSATGKIHANARDNASNYSGGGGRVAIRLTDGAFPDYWKANVLASGKTIVASGAAKAGYSSSAGTVYLEEKGEAENAGEIIVRNDGNALATDSYTVLPSLTTAKCPSDVVGDYKRARLLIGGCATVKAADDFQIVELVIEQGAKLDLNGKTLTVNVAKLGGTKLAPGEYAASDCPEFLTGEGSLVVKGTGMMILVK